MAGNAVSLVPLAPEWNPSIPVHEGNAKRYEALAA